jgi:hypothetical protein
MNVHDKKPDAAKPVKSLNYKIIVVEGDEGLNRLIQKTLQKEGYKTDCAKTGQEALDKSSGDENEILLIDYKLPDMTGSQLTKQLTQKYHKIPPVIVLTGFGNEKIAIEMMKEGVWDYMVKESDFIDILPQKIKHLCADIDKNKKLEKAEEDLRKNLEVLNDTGEMARVGGWEVNLEDNTVYWTQSTKKIHEVPEDYLPTLEEAINFFPGESKTRMGKAIDKAIQEGSQYEIESQFVTAKGNTLWVHAIGKPELKEGKCVRLHGTFQDITERKKAEEQLKALNQQLLANEHELQASNQQLSAGEQQVLAANQQLIASEQQLRAANQQLKASEEQLKAANQRLLANEKELVKSKETAELYLNISAEIMMTFDEKGKITLLNGSGHHMLGYDNHELIGKNWFETCIPREISKKLRKEFQKFMNGEAEEMSYYQNQVITKSGEFRTIRWYNHIIKNDDGKITGLLSSGEDITERIKAEEELKKSEQFSRSIISSMPNGFSILDAKGVHLDVNKSFCEMTGFSKRELVGTKPPHPYWPEEEYENINRAFEKSVQGKAGELELVFKKKNGERFPVIVSPSQLVDDKGNVISNFATIKDITEWKKVQSEIIKAKRNAEISEERFRKSQEVGHIGSWEFNLITNEFWGSDESKRIYKLDLDEEEFSAEEVMKIVAEKDREKVNQAMIDLVNKNKPYDIVFEITPKNTSEKKIIRSIAEVQRDKDGNPAKVTGILHDITEQKLAEQKIKNSESFLKAIFDNSLNAIIVSDDQGNYMICNNAAAELLGYSKEKLLKMNVADLQTIEEKGASRKYKEYIDKNKDRGEFEFITPNGDIKTALYAAIRIKKDFNLSILSDITDRKQVEIELIEAKEKAEESDRLKSAFLANMSHEIRTPMNGILGFTSLLKNPKLTGKQQERFIDIIEKSGDRMLTTINDIIDISKIESGQVDIKISNINLNNQLDELFAFFQPETTKKNIKLSITNRLPDQQASVNSDKEKLNSILVNFIKNAIKYTRGGSIEFGYSINKKANNKELEFYVKDTGIGIPTERQEAVFNRFVQADIHDKQVYEGSGLGLAISKAYVEMLGGQIWVESEEGVGSQFYFTIPYKTNTKEIHEKNAEDLNQPQSIENELKILIAEDDETAITYLSIILKEYAKEMLVAKTGIEAVEMCRNNPELDIVLMDIKMPGIDGYEATRRIREFNKDIFILAQTAYAQSEDREKAIEAGCDEYISKPINQTKLVEIISNRF